MSCTGAIQLFSRAPGYVDLDTGVHVPSLRECIEPRDNCVFSSEDYHVGELFAHGQSCIWLLGYSDLAKGLLLGRDPHSEGAASVMGISYEEFMHLLKKVKDPTAKGLRQGFKPFNFGKPTGMGDVKVCLTARRQGEDTPCPNGPQWIVVDNKRVRGYKGTRFCIVVDGADRCGTKRVNLWGPKGREQKIPPTCAHCLEVAMRLGRAWKFKNRENVAYGELCAEYLDEGMEITQAMLDRWPWLKSYFDAGMQTKKGQIMQHVTGRLRTCDGYSELANSFFQGLIGDITKEAFWRVTVECLDRTVRVPTMAHENSRPSKFGGGASPLYGSHAIGFFHDECFMEHPESVAPEAAVRVAEIMEETAMWFMPDVAPKVKAEPTLMRCWDKRAAYVTDASGRLAVWEPPVMTKVQS